MKLEKGNIVKHKAGGSAILQDQPLIKGERREESKIWFTYHWSALKAVREAVSLDPALKEKIGPGKEDRGLACAKNKRPLCFSKPLFAIVMCVFVIEYRVNQKAKQLKILKKRVNKYFDRKGDEIKLKKNKEKIFEDLSLCEKWRNIVDIWGKKTTQKYIKSVERLYEWIDMRNRIAHGNAEEILRFNISPRKALECYNDITKAIFKLNIALHDERESEEKSCRKMLLG